MSTFAGAMKSLIPNQIVGRNIYTHTVLQDTMRLLRLLLDNRERDEKPLC